MQSRYNLALIPLNKRDAVIACAQFLSVVADRYLLGDLSLPHVTLCQFQANDTDLTSIWNEVRARLDLKILKLTFEKFSCISFDQVTCWVSLLPDQIDVLTKMHHSISGIVKQAINPRYDPHMTLISSADFFCEKWVNKLEKQYTPIQDNFVLALGRSDEIGQLTEVVYR